MVPHQGYAPIRQRRRHLHAALARDDSFEAGPVPAHRGAAHVESVGSVVRRPRGSLRSNQLPGAPEAAPLAPRNPPKVPCPHCPRGASLARGTTRRVPAGTRVDQLAGVAVPGGMARPPGRRAGPSRHRLARNRQGRIPPSRAADPTPQPQADHRGGARPNDPVPSRTRSDELQRMHRPREPAPPPSVLLPSARPTLLERTQWIPPFRSTATPSWQ